MSRIGKIDRAIMEHLMDAEARPDPARGYAGLGQSHVIIRTVSNTSKMGYRSLPMPLRYMQGISEEWEFQQSKNHSIAQSIRRSLRKLERDGIVTTFEKRFTGEPEPDRNKTWCLTATYADAVFCTANLTRP